MATLDAAADWRADHDFAGVVTARAVAVLGQLVDDLIVGRPNEIGELNLADRLHAVEPHTDGTTDDAVRAERSVDDAFVTELFEQALRDAKHAAHLADIFAQHHDDAIR